MIRFLKHNRPSRPTSANRPASRVARAAGRAMVESLEQRQLLTLLGIAPLTEFPVTFYNSTGQLNYDAASDQFDVTATPETVFFASGPRAIQGGNLQIHAKVNAAGNLVRGANPGDTAFLGSINGAGDDFIINGAVDVNGDGTIDPSESGVLLTGELTAFGHQDSGGPTDQFDFRLTPTGGILMPHFTNRDIGILLTSENSTFVGSFADSMSGVPGPTGFTGGAKGSLGPTTPILGSISGTKFLDVGGDGLTDDDTPLVGTAIYLDLNNNSALDNNEPNQVTGANGQYLFTGLTPGQYIVREVVPTGYVRTSPVLVNGHTVTVVANQNAGGKDFANAALCDKSALTNITYTINGCRTVTNLRGNTNQGDYVCVTFTVRPGYPAHRYTLVSYTAPGPTFVAADANQQEIFDIDTGVFGPGTYTLCVDIPDCYYQIDFVCGPAIERFGPAGSNIFYTPQNRLFSADNDGENACRPTPCYVSGVVFIDSNNNGQRGSTERGLAGVTVTLTGTNTYGSSVNIARLTNENGQYSFGNLAPGTYRVQESQPTTFNNGQVTTTTQGATTSNSYNRVSNIVIGGGTTSANNNFGEVPISGANAILQGDAASIGFYDSSVGVTMIRSLNGSSSARSLGNYLAGTFPRLWGSSAGSTNNMSGKTNAEVSTYFTGLADRSDRSAAQVMALAISTFATSTRYAGGEYSRGYGFEVSSNGTAAKTTNIGGIGWVFGVNNSSNVTLLGLLQAANSRADDGEAFGQLGDTSKASAIALLTNVNTLGQLVS